MSRTIFSRTWAMPSADTFSIPPIAAFVDRYLTGISVDPFARNSTKATYTNDLNPNTLAQRHTQASIFLDDLATEGIVADCVLFDPPYSPRQISECYTEAGLTATMESTQNALLYKNCRRRIEKILRVGGYVLSFGWNSVGFGREFELRELLLVCHGGAHNDTICLAEQRVIKQLMLPV